MISTSYRNWASQKWKTYRKQQVPRTGNIQKASFTGREAKLHFKTQTVDCFQQIYHKYNGLKSPDHPSFSKPELGMCQCWVRLISCPSSQTYFRPIHQGHPRSQMAFTEHLMPTTQLHSSGYTIHILFLFYNWSLIIFSNHFIAQKIGVTAILIRR